MSSKQAMWSVMAMLTIWCTWNSVNINKMSQDHEVVEEIGENGTFTWNDKQYTTRYAIEGDLASK